jgi:isopentenyl-diphosphate delta-isomerase
LHRAFSVILVDPDGRLLLQRRSAAKTRFPLRWANACCGHPPPGRIVTDAARDRLAEEIGVRGIELTAVGVHVYRADDPATSRVEHEYDHVLLGRVDARLSLAPDAAEVADLRWLPAVDVPAAVAADPAAYAPWLAGVVATLDAAGVQR